MVEWIKAIEKSSLVSTGNKEETTKVDNNSDLLPIYLDALTNISKQDP